MPGLTTTIIIDTGEKLQLGLPEARDKRPAMSVLNSLKNGVMERSRKGKLMHFYSEFESGMTVLDVGVSSELKKGLPAKNYFLKNFRYDSAYYTGLGVQDLVGMEELFPGKRFVQYAGGRFPFDDRQFDWVFSNAVIEHVGDDSAQLAFLDEMLRVASGVFFTTPNKYFPLETHTNVLLLHWTDGFFCKCCNKNRPWFKKDNLYLISYDKLGKLLDMSNVSDHAIFPKRFLGLTRTFTVVCHQ